MKSIRARRQEDRFFGRLFFITAVLSVVILLAIFGMLVINGLHLFKDVSISDFLFSSNWNPGAYKHATYGVLSLLTSTLLVTFGALIIAVPLGIGTAAYLSEIAPSRLREVLKPIIELLAAIPSVTIGFIGIVMTGPIIARTFGLENGFNALNGSILLSIMALPTIITVAEEAIRAVPNSYKEASYALGGNKFTTLMRITLPSAFSGIIAAIMLGVGRAIGETMTVLMATGNAAAMPHGFFDSVKTMTATIAIELGEVAYGTTHYYSLFAVGSLLFIMSLFFNILAEYLAARYRIKTP
jgi:phosphate transport system permease protein